MWNHWNPPALLVGRMIIGLTTLENSLAVSCKSQQRLFYNPEIPLLDMFTKNTYMWALKDKCENVHFGIICSNQKLETIYMSINSETDELTVEYHKLVKWANYCYMKQQIQINPRNTILSKGNQTGHNTECIILFTKRIKTGKSKTLNLLS